MKIILFLILLFNVTRIRANLNILFLSGIPSPGHYIFNKALAEALAHRGHNITFVSPDVSNEVVKNFHYIHLERIYEHFYNSANHINLLEMSKESTLKSVFSFYDFGAYMCEGIRMSRGIHVIKNYPKNFRFDLVIYDYVCGPCLLGLLPKFKYPPVIGISAFNNPQYTVDIVGGDKLGLTVKPFYLLNYDINMTFSQRLHNGFINFLDSFYRKYFAIPAIDKQMKFIFGSETPYADDLDKKAIVMLVNSHPVTDYPESLPQNIIQVGGLQIKDPKPIPHDINKFILDGKKGAILMALGTNLRSDVIGDHVIMNILEAFRHMPDYNFIWKFETPDMLKDLPSNIMVKDWLPQNDILASPHVKAFITHGGLLSTHEAVWHGVPMIKIPFYADQHRNTFRSVHSGIAVKVDYQTLNSEKLRKAIIEVLHNPNIRKTIIQKSKLFKDQPEKPIDRAVWWCEFIMRHPKIIHLRPDEFNLGLLKSHFWDIQMILLAILVAFIWIVRKVYVKYVRSFILQMLEAQKIENMKKIGENKTKLKAK